MHNLTVAQGLDSVGIAADDNADAPLAPKDRGTIIVDTGFFFGMASKTGEKRSDGTPAHYLDILTGLAQAGYQIIIPEMISYEAGRRLTDHIHLASYFDHSGELLCDNDPAIDRFLNNVSLGLVPNISIAKKTGPAHVDEFISGVHTIVDSNEFSADSNPRAKEYIRAQIMRLRDRHDLTKHYGDDAIISLVQQTPPDRKLFVFTDDVEMVKELNTIYPERANLHFASNKGISWALSKSGLIAEMPFISQKQGGRGFIYHREKEAKKMFTRKHGTKYGIDCTSATMKPSSLQPEMHDEDGPLCQSFKELAQDMEQRPVQLEIKTITPTLEQRDGWRLSFKPNDPVEPREGWVKPAKPGGELFRR